MLYNQKRWNKTWDYWKKWYVFCFCSYQGYREKKILYWDILGNKRPYLGFLIGYSEGFRDGLLDGI